jgi:adenylate cyclase
MAYPLPDKPSIAVMPFENYSDDAKLVFFASGLTEDLTAALSRAPGLFIISMSSAATYKGKPIDVKRVAEEQGVQYVLEGSVQEAGGKLRITVQLVDALNGLHLWADRFDRPARDIFELQDEIVKHVIVELQVELTQGAAARVASRGTDNLEAWLLRIEAYGELTKFTREGMIRARELYEAAHQADPGWSQPIASLASIDWYEAKQGWRIPKEEAIRSGMALAQRAIQLDPEAPLGYQTLGNLYALSGQAERAIELRRKAAELAPNDLFAVAGLATRLKDFGGEQEAVQLFEQTMRLSPKHQWWVPSAYGVALHLVGRKEEAVVAFKKAIALKSDHVHPRAFLTAVYADLGRMDEARSAANEVMRLNPKFTATRFMQSHSLHDSERDVRFKDLMPRAGLPE